MMEAVKYMPGIPINRQNFNNRRYADDAVFITDEEKKLHNLLNKIQKVCMDYNMNIDTKNTKVLAFSKKGE
jgi:hypothetical protein